MCRLNLWWDLETAVSESQISVIAEIFNILIAEDHEDKKPTYDMFSFW